MVFSQHEHSWKRARKPSPVRTTLLSQSSTMQARTEQAFINIFQRQPGKQCRHWVLQSPRSWLGLCRVLPTPTRFTPAYEHLLARSVLLDGKCKPKLEFLNFFFLLSPRSLASHKISFEMKVETENDEAQKDQIMRQSNSEDLWTPKQYKGHPEIKIPSSALRVTSPPHQRGFMFIFCAGKGNWRGLVLRRGHLLLSPSRSNLDKEGFGFWVVSAPSMSVPVQVVQRFITVLGSVQVAWGEQQESCRGTCMQLGDVGLGAACPKKGQPWRWRWPWSVGTRTLLLPTSSLLAFFFMHIYIKK